MSREYKEIPHPSTSQIITYSIFTIYEACPESKDTKVLDMYNNLIYKSDTVNELPVHNYFST
jgi:hypothetical protein